MIPSTCLPTLTCLPVLNLSPCPQPVSLSSTCLPVLDLSPCPQLSLCHNLSPCPHLYPCPGSLSLPSTCLPALDPSPCLRPVSLPSPCLPARHSAIPLALTLNLSLLSLESRRELERGGEKGEEDKTYEELSISISMCSLPVCVPGTFSKTAV